MTIDKISDSRAGIDTLTNLEVSWCNFAPLVLNNDQWPTNPATIRRYVYTIVMLVDENANKLGNFARPP